MNYIRTSLLHLAFTESSPGGDPAGIPDASESKGKGFICPEIRIICMEIMLTSN